MARAEAITDRIGQRIRETRRRQGMSQSELARRGGMSRNTVVDIERGMGSSINSVQKLASVLDLSVESLIVPPREPVWASQDIFALSELDALRLAVGQRDDIFVAAGTVRRLIAAIDAITDDSPTPPSVEQHAEPIPEPNDAVGFAKFIKRTRRALRPRVTQTDLGLRVGVSRQWIYSIERGAECSPALRARILQELGLEWKV